MKKSLLFLALALCFASPAFAEGDAGDTCEAACPDGQVRTSFLDGHQVNCVCMDPGQPMVDDQATVYGTEGDQANQTS